MFRLIRSPGPRRMAVTAVAGVLAFSGVVASAGAASADTILKASYPVTGSTYIKAPKVTLASTVDVTTGSLTANLTLPDATGSFNDLGLVPVTATTQFINKGPTTGKIDLNTGVVHTTSRITLRVVDLKVAGIDLPVGNSCQTATPVTVKVVS